MTLRRAIVAVLLTAWAAILVVGVTSYHCPGWAAPLLWIGGLIVAFVFERQRYSPRIDPAGAWHETGERFIDPVSGRRLRVFVNRETGARDYRPLA